MPETINMLTNINEPAPRWYRKMKRIVGLLSGPVLISFIQIFNPSEHIIARIGQIVAFLPTILELFNAALANGEEYAPKGTTKALEDANAKAESK